MPLTAWRGLPSGVQRGQTRSNAVRRWARGRRLLSNATDAESEPPLAFKRKSTEVKRAMAMEAGCPTFRPAGGCLSAIGRALPRQRCDRHEPRWPAGPPAIKPTRLGTLRSRCQGDRDGRPDRRLPPDRSCAPTRRRQGRRRHTSRRRRRPRSVCHRRSPGPGPAGRFRQSAAERRPRALLRQPAHQSDQRLRAAEYLRLLLVRPDAEGGGRLHPVAGGGLPRGGAGARDADPRVPHRGRAASQAPAELLHGHAARAQGASPAGAHQGADRGRDRPPGPHRADHRARGAAWRCSEAGLTSLPGGGAEVFSTAVRATIAERKLTGEEWIRVHRDGPRAGHPHQLHHALRPRRDRGGSDRAPDHAARAAGRHRRLPHLHPAGLSPRPQRARRGDGARRAPPRPATRTSRTSPSAGCSSTTSRTSRPTGRW